MDGSNSYQNIIFPRSFTNTSYKILCTDYDSSATTSYTDIRTITVASKYNTNTGTRIVASEAIGGYYWFAIGY